MIQKPNFTRGLRPRKLHPTAQRILDLMGPPDSIFDKGQGHLAEQVGISERMIRRHITKLIDLGRVEVVEPGRGHSRSNKVYRVSQPEPLTLGAYSKEFLLAEPTGTLQPSQPEPVRWNRGH